MKLVIPVVVLAVLVGPATAHAQTQSTKLTDAEGRPVFVIDFDSREWQGTLLKVSKESLTIVSEAGTRDFPLTSVKRVDADGDGVRDGAIKGAVFGLTLGAFSAGHGGAARMMIGGALIYGLVGTALDAAHHTKHTVYNAPARQN